MNMTPKDYWDSLPQFKRDRAPYQRYTPKRVDKNQGLIVRIFRELGFSVHLLHEAGHGMFDLIIAKGGLNALVEVKNGDSPPSARKLTPPQRAFNFSWLGMRAVVTNADEAHAVAIQLHDMLHLARQMGLKFEIMGSTEKQYQPDLYV